MDIGRTIIFVCTFCVVVVCVVGSLFVIIYDLVSHIKTSSKSSPGFIALVAVCVILCIVCIVLACSELLTKLNM